MDVHLVDGTYELFRYYFALPSHVTGDGLEVGATRGVVGSVLRLLEEGATHVGVATDHVIESFRNDLWAGYKTGEGVVASLRAQFELLEEVLAAAGVLVWAMVEYEADDALGAAAARAAADPRVDRVLVCTPDKDLGQCVGGKVVQLDRRAGTVRDAAGIRDKFGVEPASVPDYLALVGDSADGFPGLPGWGAKSAAAVLSRYGHLEHIPARSADWDLTVRNGGRLAKVLAEQLELALLFRRIATLETDAPVFDDVEDLRWVGSQPDFAGVCEQLDAPGLAQRAAALAEQRGAARER